MGLYIATATPDQLALLAAALELITAAEAAAPTRRTPEQDEIAQFISRWHEVEEQDDPDASLSAWVSVVRVLTLAVATTPGPPSDRPMWLYDPHGVATPTPTAAGSTPAADTLTLLERLDLEGLDADGRKSVDLDETGWQAWQRLVAEWHAAVYGPRADEPDAKLSSFAY